MAGQFTVDLMATVDSDMISNEIISITISDGDTLLGNFSDIYTGNYSFNFVVSDTTAMDEENVTVSAVAER